MGSIPIIMDECLNLRVSDLSKEELKKLKSEFAFKNPEYFKVRAMGFSTQGLSPNIILWEEKNKGKLISFPRGNLEKLQEILEDRKFTVRDKRIEVPLQTKIQFKSDFSFWPQQIPAIEKAIVIEQGLVHGVCGSGKTEILLGIFARLKQRTLVIVDKLKLMEQWVERAKKRFVNLNICVIGGGKWEIGDLTIGSQKTLVRHIDKIKEKFGVVICDEVHHFAARTFQDLISKLKAKYRIGATATLKRKDRKEFMVYAAFGDVIHRITDEHLLEDGKIFEIEMIVVPTKFIGKSYVNKQRNKVTGDIEITGYNYHLLLAEMKTDIERNKLIISTIKREVKQGHKCLIMADRISHCIYMKRLLKRNGIVSSLMVGEKEFRKERDNAPRLLKSRKISCIVVSPLVQEGFDLPELDRGFIINPSATNEAKLQQQTGRIKRIAEGKDSAKCYYFWDKKVYGFDSHLDKIKKLFPKLEIYES